MIICLSDYLKKNPYPGRGICLGRSEDGKSGIIVYFIMGRSENSRNRVFVEDGADLRTKAFDPAKLADPSLIIYRPVAVFGNATIVTNGDQTDTIAEYLSTGRTFEDALRTRVFEPDGPNYTPRISGILSRDGSYKLSILKCADGRGGACDRYFFEYNGAREGFGHFLSTYTTDGEPLPPFEGEPFGVLLGGSINELSRELWMSLNEDNRVSLFVRYVNLETGGHKTVVINRHDERA